MASDNLTTLFVGKVQLRSYPNPAEETRLRHTSTGRALRTLCATRTTHGDNFQVDIYTKFAIDLEMHRRTESCLQLGPKCPDLEMEIETPIWCCKRFTLVQIGISNSRNEGL